MSFTREELQESEKSVGQIYPVLKDKNGNIIDGFHRKFVNPDWKEEILDVDDPLTILKIRVHAQYRRLVPKKSSTMFIASHNCKVVKSRLLHRVYFSINAYFIKVALDSGNNQYPVG